MITNTEVEVLNEMCKNTGMAIDAINTVLNKVYDDDFAYDLNRQANKYREYERKVRNKLMEEGLDARETKRMEKAMLWSSIQASTLLNTSTGHMADMMIKGNARGITDLLKVTHNNKAKGSFANELANELMDFEEKNIEKLKSYL